MTSFGLTSSAIGNAGLIAALCASAFAGALLLYRRRQSQSQPAGRRHRQHVARPVHVRRADPHRRGELALSRDVQAVARDREARAAAAGIDPAPQGHRPVHRRRRRLLQEHHRRACARARAAGIYVQASDGRIVLAKNQPLPGGGWVSTHEDVTEQRRAEEERAAIHDQEQRRAAIDAAIASFRPLAERLLGSVGDSATAMRTTADCAVRLVRRRPRSARKARCRRSTRPRPMSRRGRVAADELSHSIGEISRQLTQTGSIVARRDRGSARDRRRDRRSRRRRAEDRRRRQADPQHRRPDQSARAQRHHRGGARRRGRPRLCRRRVGSEIAGGADRQGDRGHRQPHPRRCRTRPPARSRRSATSPRACRRSTSTPRRSRPRSKSRTRRPARSRTTSPSAAQGTSHVVGVLGEVARCGDRDARLGRSGARRLARRWKARSPICASRSRTSSPRWRCKRRQLQRSRALAMTSRAMRADAALLTCLTALRRPKRLRWATNVGRSTADATMPLLRLAGRASCRAPPAPPQAARSARGTASRRRSRARPRGRRRPRPDRRHARRRCRA